MIVSYGRFENYEGISEKFSTFIQSLILSRSSKHIAEIGAGANPAISQGFVTDHLLEYVPIDTNVGELAKAGLSRHVVFDPCKAVGEVPGAPYDLIFSQSTVEHFNDADLAYCNIFRSLIPGGFCVHSFPCLYALPFVVNWALPGPASRRLLNLVYPRDSYRYPKFKAYYRRCRGPIPKQIEFLKHVGFEVVEYRAYFGHDYYKRKFKLLDSLEKVKTQMLLRRPVPYLVSCATVILRRPT